MADYLTAATLDATACVRHGFFTRKGGVSGGLYAGLNCGIGSMDERAAVTENRARVAHAMGIARDRLITPYQIHSANVVTADGPWLPGTDAPRADAIVTRLPGLAIAVSTADCTPILFADGEARVIGAAHAGWRGALSGVLEATIAAMEALGAGRTHIRAAIGPTIAQSAYEVGPEFRDTFTAADPANAKFFDEAPGKRPHFDLPAYVRARLVAAGLGAIEDLAVCTYQDEARFFSYRRCTHRGEADYGRQVSVIALNN